MEVYGLAAVRLLNGSSSALPDAEVQPFTPFCYLGNFFDRLMSMADRARLILPTA